MTHFFKTNFFDDTLSSELVNPLSSVFDNMLQREFPEFYKQFNGVSVTKGSYPKLNIEDYEDKFIIETEIAGLTKEDISIKVKDGLLTISGKKKERKIDGKLVYCELKRSSFSRSIQLNELVDESKIIAKFENGILEILLPKIKPQKISEDEKIIKID